MMEVKNTKKSLNDALNFCIKILEVEERMPYYFIDYHMEAPYNDIQKDLCLLVESVFNEVANIILENYLIERSTRHTIEYLRSQFKDFNNKYDYILLGSLNADRLRQIKKDLKTAKKV